MCVYLQLLLTNNMHNDDVMTPLCLLWKIIYLISNLFSGSSCFAIQESFVENVVRFFFLPLGHPINCTGGYASVAPAPFKPKTHFPPIKPHGNRNNHG